jgi:hypothetical protein
LAELFQWRTDDEIESLVAEASRRDVEREIADIAIYFVRLADVLGNDLESVVKAMGKDQNVQGDVVLVRLDRSVTRITSSHCSASA